jgi:hypothetical protein
MSELSESVFVRQLDADGYQDFLIWLKDKEQRIREDERRQVLGLLDQPNAILVATLDEQKALARKLKYDCDKQLATAQARIAELEECLELGIEFAEAQIRSDEMSGLDTKLDKVYLAKMTKAAKEAK